MERKLATLEVISELHPIPDADAIERAVIRGWNVVVKKGEFSIGDLCVYCEIDSLLPERPEFEFLRSRGFRIRTVKFRGQISQGIAFPVDIIPFGITLTDPGQDLTEILGITKYEPPIPACLSGTAKGGFPSHSIKTDEERIQNLKDVYDEYRKYTWVVTEKLDGSSVTYSIVNDEFEVSSRNLNLKEDNTNSFWKVAKDLDIEKKMRTYMKEHDLDALTLQGELIGEGIQKNKYRIKGQTVKFFRVFNPTKYQFMPYIFGLAQIGDMGLDHVPLLDIDFTLPADFDTLIKYADGRSALAETTREGVVLIAKEVDDKYQGRLSFKVISNRYILKNE